MAYEEVPNLVIVDDQDTKEMDWYEDGVPVRSSTNAPKRVKARFELVQEMLGW